MPAENKTDRRLHLSIRSAVVLAQFPVLFLFSVLAVGVQVFEWEAGPLIYPACLLLTALFLWCVWSWKKVTHSLFDPYILFLAAAMLFNGGRALLEVFKLNPYGLRNLAGPHGYIVYTFSERIILQALVLVSLGLAYFHAGALIGAAKKSLGRVQAPAQPPRLPSARSMRLVGWFLLLISAAPTVLVLGNLWGIVRASGYLGIFKREASTGIQATPQVLMGFLVPAALFLLAGSKKRPLGIAVSSLVILAYSGTQLLLGTRSWAVMPLIAYAWLWHRTIRPVPRVVIAVAAGLMLFVVFPVISLTRGTPGMNRLSLSVLVENFLSINNPVVEIVSEMGESIKTVGHTLERVPSLRGFDWGVGYFYALLTVLPNFFWAVHPTIERGLAATWLVSSVSPEIARAGGGYGYSFIAEAYLNFGWVGSAVILAVIGLVFARAVFWAQRSNEPAKLAAVGSFMAFSLAYARSESGIIVRPLVWYALLPYLLVFVVSFLLRKRPYEPGCHA